MRVFAAVIIVSHGAAFVTHQPVNANTAATKLGYYPGMDELGTAKEDGDITGAESRILGGSLKTWSFDDPLVDLVQVSLTSEGRPLKSLVELWVGPENTPYRLGVYVEDGDLRPFNAAIAAPGGSNSVAVRNIGHVEFPFSASIKADKSFSGFGDMGKGRVVQGGAVHTIPFPPSVQSIKLMLKTDGRPMNARIELMQGPYTDKQVMEIYTDDGMLRPFFAVIETPGVGNVVRIVNTDTVEFPLTAYAQPFAVSEPPRLATPYMDQQSRFQPRMDQPRSIPAGPAQASRSPFFDMGRPRIVPASPAQSRDRPRSVPAPAASEPFYPDLQTYAALTGGRPKVTANVDPLRTIPTPAMGRYPAAPGRETGVRTGNGIIRNSQTAFVPERQTYSRSAPSRSVPAAPVQSRARFEVERPRSVTAPASAGVSDLYGSRGGFAPKVDQSRSVNQDSRSVSASASAGVSDLYGSGGGFMPSSFKEDARSVRVPVFAGDSDRYGSRAGFAAPNVNQARSVPTPAGVPDLYSSAGIAMPGNY